MKKFMFLTAFIFAVLPIFGKDVKAGILDKDALFNGDTLVVNTEARVVIRKITIADIKDGLKPCVRLRVKDTKINEKFNFINDDNHFVIDNPNIDGDANDAVIIVLTDKEDFTIVTNTKKFTVKKFS